MLSVRELLRKLLIDTYSNIKRTEGDMEDHQGVIQYKKQNVA